LSATYLATQAEDGTTQEIMEGPVFFAAAAQLGSDQDIQLEASGLGVAAGNAAATLERRLGDANIVRRAHPSLAVVMSTPAS
jgi:hypothetical protein